MYTDLNVDVGLTPEVEYKHVRHITHAVKSNMAQKRGVAPGNGFIGAMGIRYRYTEPKGSKRPKLAGFAAKCAGKYGSVLKSVQKVSNAMCRIVMMFTPSLRDEMKQVHNFTKKICDVGGTASFWFPVATIGVNGAFATHCDHRDTRTTLWASLKHGGLCFPGVTIVVIVMLLSLTVGGLIPVLL